MHAGARAAGWALEPCRSPDSSDFDVRDTSIEKGSITLTIRRPQPHATDVIIPVWEMRRRHAAGGAATDWAGPTRATGWCRSRRICRGAADSRSLNPRHWSRRPPRPPIPVKADPLPNAAGFVDHVEQPAKSKFQVETIRAGRCG